MDNNAEYDEYLDELAEIMAEPPGGYNHGRTSMGPGASSRHERTLDVETWLAEDYRESTRYVRGDVAGMPGAGIVDTRRGSSSTHRVDAAGIVGIGGSSAGRSYGASDAGAIAHRGPLQPDAYVDEGLLVAMIEAKLGFTRAELTSVSAPGGGRPSKEHAALSRRINARLAELHAAGTNFALLAPILGTSKQALLQRAKNLDGSRQLSDVKVRV